jgi:RNA polymerase sigma factor (sigma-70 family)
MTAAESIAIVDGVQHGDPQAERDLYQLCWRYRSTKRIGQETGEDLAHDLFICLWLAIRAGQIRNPAALSGYVCRARQNGIFRWYRETENKIEKVELTELSAVTRRTPEDDAAANEQYAALDALPRREREIVLRFCAGEPFAEIAEHMNMLEATCKTIKFRVIAQMRARLSISRPANTNWPR